MSGLSLDPLTREVLVGVRRNQAPPLSHVAWWTRFYELLEAGSIRLSLTPYGAARLDVDDDRGTP